MNLYPWETLLVELLHEWIWVELLDVVHAWSIPLASEEHHCANHSWHACGVAYALHTCLEISIAVAAVVIDVVGMLLAIVADTTDAAAD